MTTYDLAGPKLDDEADVRAWFDELLEAGLNFHPEDSFLDMVEYATGAAPFSASDARSMDAAMVRCGELVEDPCEVALEVLAERGR